MLNVIKFCSKEDILCNQIETIVDQLIEEDRLEFDVHSLISLLCKL